MHRCLQQAVLIGYLRNNPADVCNLPKIPKSHIQPLSDEQIAAMIHQLQSYPSPYTTLYFVTLFTGMRQGEALGLSWMDIDFNRSTIHVRWQLRKLRKKGAGYEFAVPKDNDSRLIRPADAGSTVQNGNGSSWPQVRCGTTPKTSFLPTNSGNIWHISPCIKNSRY